MIKLINIDKRYIKYNGTSKLLTINNTIFIKPLHFNYSTVLSYLNFNFNSNYYSISITNKGINSFPYITNTTQPFKSIFP